MIGDEAAQISVTAGYDGKPCSAYEKLTFRLSSRQAINIRITVADAVFEKHVAAFEGEFWIGIHRHLLPAGEHPVVCEAFGERGQVVWRQEIRLVVDPLNRLGQAVRDSLLARATQVLFEGPLDTSFYDFADPSLWPWFDRADANTRVDACLSAGEIEEIDARRLHGLVQEGFFVIPGLVDEAHLGRLRADLDQAAADGFDGYQWGSSRRMHHLHYHSRAMAELWRHPVILSNLRMVFETEPRPCQTLSFIFGSEQGAHQDTIHLTPFPAGYMMGVWVALEDVRPGSGELFYFPGSHRAPRVYAHHAGWPGLFGFGKEAPGGPGFGHLAEAAHRGFKRLADGYARVDYLPKAGDVLFWHENLLHGGAPRRDPGLTRKSVAMHYFADGCVAFYDSWGEPAFMAPTEE